MSNKDAKIIFQKWKTALLKKDRTMNSVLNNTNELFFNMSNAEIDLTVAHEYVKHAVIEHMPTLDQTRWTYETTKSNEKTFKEFVNDWKDLIKSHVEQAFFSWYIEESDQSEKLYGNMSAHEYSAQRKYVDSFPDVNFKELLECQDALIDDDFDLGEFYSDLNT